MKECTMSEADSCPLVIAADDDGATAEVAVGRENSGDAGGAAAASVMADGRLQPAGPLELRDDVVGPVEVDGRYCRGESRLLGAVGRRQQKQRGSE